VQSQRPLEIRGKVGVGGNQSLTSERAGTRPRLSLGARRGCEVGDDLTRLVVMAEPGVGDGKLGCRRHVGVSDLKITH